MGINTVQEKWSIITETNRRVDGALTNVTDAGEWTTLTVTYIVGFGKITNITVLAL